MKQTTAIFTLKTLATCAFILALGACSSQNWYQGAQSAREAHCLQQPLSEYNDCMQESDTNYSTYQQQREELLKKPAEKE